MVQNIYVFCSSCMVIPKSNTASVFCAFCYLKTNQYVDAVETLRHKHNDSSFGRVVFAGITKTLLQKRRSFNLIHMSLCVYTKENLFVFSQRSDKNLLITHSTLNFQLFDITVTLKCDKGHWKWQEWVKLYNNYHHAKIETSALI